MELITKIKRVNSSQRSKKRCFTIAKHQKYTLQIFYPSIIDFIPEEGYRQYLATYNSLNVELETKLRR